MKATIPHNLRNLSLAALALIAIADVSAQSGDFIRQTQLDGTGIMRDYYVPTDEGSAPSSMPISLKGSEFSLYAAGIGFDEKTYFLDSKIVGAYLPKANVTLVSEDPYVPMRTRADKPIGVYLEASGMVANTSAPNHQREVFYRHVYEEYDRETYAAPLDIDTVQVEHESFYFSNTQPNNPMYRYPQYTALPPDASGDTTKAMGEEVFTIFSVSSADIPSYSVLDSETIQVWPVADGKITVEGKNPGERILRDVPPVSWTANDLYPASVTYLQIYPGMPEPGTVGTVIQSPTADGDNPVKRHFSSVPTNHSAIFEEWDDEQYTPEDGIYTLELLTVTPFNDGAPEILDTFHFEIDRTIKVRAHVGGSE